MSQWEVEFAGAVANLETAYAVDQRAYDALRDPLKASWALLPTWMWPEPERVGALLRARIELVAAEDDVRDLVRRQSIAIRNARARRMALYQRRAFAQTTPDELARRDTVAPLDSASPTTVSATQPATEV